MLTTRPNIWNKQFSLWSESLQVKHKLPHKREPQTWDNPTEHLLTLVLFQFAWQYNCRPADSDVVMDILYEVYYPNNQKAVNI